MSINEGLSRGTAASANAGGTENTTGPIKLRLLADHVHIRRAPEAERFVGSSLVIPDNQRSRLQDLMQGEVLGVGPGVVSKTGHRQPLGVKVGDRVVFSGTAWFERPSRIGHDELLIQENDIVGVIGG
jgi:co-chaperonin GroES (HSP10)